MTGRLWKWCPDEPIIAFSAAVFLRLMLFALCRTGPAVVAVVVVDLPFCRILPQAGLFSSEAHLALEASPMRSALLLMVRGRTMIPFTVSKALSFTAEIVS